MNEDILKLINDLDLTEGDYVTGQSIKNPTVGVAGCVVGINDMGEMLLSNELDDGTIKQYQVPVSTFSWTKKPTQEAKESASTNVPITFEHAIIRPAINGWTLEDCRYTHTQAPMYVFDTIENLAKALPKIMARLAESPKQPT